MSSHASAAIEEPVAESHSESYKEPVVESHSESKGKPVAENHSESKGKPVAENHYESCEEPVPHFHSESSEEPVPEIHSESYEDPVPDIHSDGKRKPDAEIQSGSYEHPVPQIHSQSKRNPDAENHSESYEEPVPEIPSKSEREPVTQIPSKSERETVPEIPSKTEIEPVPGIPSKNERDPVAERKPFPESPSTSKRMPRLKKILTQSERDSDAESDDGQQRLPGASLYGKKPRRWISEEEWLNNMKEDPHVRLSFWSRVSIFRIPNFLKDTKREAYVPQRISLGPYHHRSAELLAMDHYKGRALRNMMTRFNDRTILYQDDMTFANSARNAILEREDEIRDHYEESIDCDGNTLSMMLSLDGCFILEVLKTLDDDGYQTGKINDPIFGANTFGANMVAASNTMKDILMLENQIPWIVLQELLQLENPKDNDVETTLLDVMVKGTCGLFKISSKDRTALLAPDRLRSRNPEVHHLLGFLHNVIVHRPSDHANPGNQGEHRISIKRCIGRCLQMLPDKNKALNHDFDSIPPAVELNNAGIKFRPCNGAISQIKFDTDSSTIYLPLLPITYDTEVLLRNLIALEMCKPSETDYVSAYLNLMDDLIDTQKDVAFLRSMGILTNLLGSNQEVADLFNGLFKGVTVRKPNTFVELKKNVNANYKNSVRVQLAELWRDHFSSPWKAIALAVAFAILCLTLIQTIYTVKK